MNFIEYLKFRVNLWFQNRRPCNTCRGSDGHCNLCNERHNLYKKDYLKVHRKAHLDENVWW